MRDSGIRMQRPIIIGSDHAGLRLKTELARYLSSKKYEIADMGPYEYVETDDYPDYALRVCEEVVRKNSRGILICSTGQGMDRVANKIYGIRASVAWDELSARIAKEHGDVNVLCLGQMTTSYPTAKRILDIWLRSPRSSAARHARRRRKIGRIERSYFKRG